MVDDSVARDDSGAPDEWGSRQPEGGVYEWYRRGLELLAAGSPDAAAAVLEHARSAEPGSASVREALARALFDAKNNRDAEELFREAAATDPADDYAQFGLGLALYRQGDAERAVEPLSIAVAMRPGRKEYQEALRQARATVRAREAASSDEATETPEGQEGTAS
ncbi:MAG: tetratricopeptide repeat protein [Actinomycetes bacterium]